ncbi:L-serine ammonia-lyase, iron-sulfur-dependent, subunit alpha [Peribacillus sp. NPDC060186]
MNSLLGLVCDPVAGLVEVPCIKQNVTGTSIAFSVAEMPLTGIESRILCDEVIDIGIDMPRTLRETSFGGLAMKETGKQEKNIYFAKNHNWG